MSLLTAVPASFLVFSEPEAQLSHLHGTPPFPTLCLTVMNTPLCLQGAGAACSESPGAGAGSGEAAEEFVTRRGWQHCSQDMPHPWMGQTALQDSLTWDK